MAHSRTRTHWPLASKIAVAICGLGLLSSSTALAQEAFVPSDYEEGIETAHQRDSSEHVLTVQKITGQVENLNSGKITVASVTQILSCKTGKLLSQSRCDPCEYNVAEWPRRPVDRWFVERSWPQGSHVARKQAEMQMAHFTRYFQLAPADGTEHQGFTYSFWAFDGRRGTPLVRKKSGEIKVAKQLIETQKPKFGPVQKIEILHGTNRPVELDYPSDGSSLKLTAEAYAMPVGQTGLAPVEDFTALWSTSCATLSSTSAKEIVFSLKNDSDRCSLHLYEGRTGVEDTLTVVRRHKKPKVRVAITFEGGREADGIELTGNIRKVELEVHAFDPEGKPLKGFKPEWGIECGKVEFLDGESRRRLRLHLEKGVTRCEVHAREPDSGAEDFFLIKAG